MCRSRIELERPHWTETRKWNGIQKGVIVIHWVSERHCYGDLCWTSKLRGLFRRNASV